MVKQHVYLCHNLRTGLAHLPGAQCRRERQRLGCAASEADVDRNLLSFDQGYVFDEESHHALAFAIRRRRFLPKPRQVRCECEDAPALNVIKDGSVIFALALVLLLSFGECTEFSVPFRLELVGHKAVVGVDLHEASARQVRLVASSLHLSGPKPIRLISAGRKLLLNGYGGFQRHRSHCLDKQAPYGFIDVPARDALADGLCPPDSALLAQVRRRQFPVPLVVPDGHAIAADTADYQALEERGTFARRALPPLAPPRLGALAKPPLILLELLPGDVSGMGIRYERDPLLPRQSLERAVAVSVPALAGPAEEESAGEAGIVQDPQRARVL